MFFDMTTCLLRKSRNVCVHFFGRLNLASKFLYCDLAMKKVTVECGEQSRSTGSGFA